LRSGASSLYRHDVDVRIEQMLEKSSAVNRGGVNLYNRIQRSAPWVHKLFYACRRDCSACSTRQTRSRFGKRYYVDVLKRIPPAPHLQRARLPQPRIFPACPRAILGADQVRCATYCSEFAGGWGYSRNWIEPTVDLYISRTPTAHDYAVKKGMPPRKGDRPRLR
jgi:processive 1,2-diacylglycerol beta-glucosyltransferase